MMAFMLANAPMLAQNNVYGIDDDCYKMYNNLLHTPLSEKDFLEYADKMYKLGEEKKDKKAQTLAICVKAQFYEGKNDLAKTRACAEELKKEAKRTGHMQYYYFAYRLEIRLLQKKGMTDEGLALAKKMQSEALKDDYKFGLYSAYETIGDIYMQRRNIAVSSEYYQKAIDLHPNITPRQRVSILYNNLAENTKNLHFKKELCMKALENAIDGLDSIRTYDHLCRIYGSFGRNKESLNYYNLGDHCIKKNRPADKMSFTSQTYYHIFSGNKSEALKTFNKITSSNVEKAAVGKILAEQFGLDSIGYEVAKILNSNKLKYDAAFRGFEFAEINDLLENDKLKSMHSEQERNHTEILLQQQRMRIEKQKLEDEQERLSSDNLKIDRKNKRIEADNKKKFEELGSAEIASKLKLEKAKEEESKQLRKTLLITVGMLLVLLIIIISFIIYYKKSKKRLLLYTKELHMARCEAEEASEMKNIFIQNMSHEIRTPLNAVMGFSQLLTIPGLPISEEERTEYASHILNNSKMLTMLVDDILNINDIENGNYNINPVFCPVNEILSSAVSSAEYRAHDGVRVYYTSEVDNDYTVYTDPRRVQQVLINFLTNACKHTDSGSIHLHLSIQETPDMLTFSVADTGCGIPREQAENIFERFTKLNDFKQGTGLGLNICRLISKKMEGHVYCDVNYTDGARFVFTIPLIKQQN